VNLCSLFPFNLSLLFFFTLTASFRSPARIQSPISKDLFAPATVADGSKFFWEPWCSSTALTFSLDFFSRPISVIACLSLGCYCIDGTLLPLYQYMPPSSPCFNGHLEKNLLSLVTCLSFLTSLISSPVPVVCWGAFWACQKPTMLASRCLSLVTLSAEELFIFTSL